MRVTRSGLSLMIVVSLFAGVTIRSGAQTESASIIGRITDSSGMRTNTNYITVDGVSGNFGTAFQQSNSGQVGDPISYVYDDLGRLAAVIDPSGNAASDQYDAVGNILAITRYSAGQTSVLNFSPRTGPIGTTVTITGTGFSTTISQDAVSSNSTTVPVIDLCAASTEPVRPDRANVRQRRRLRNKHHRSIFFGRQIKFAHDPANHLQTITQALTKCFRRK
jgi:YD repeat-containing protein